MDRMIRQMEAHPRFRLGERWHAYAYGTAGFRDRAEVLDAVLVRLGCLAALYSRSKGGAAVGVMITASHNLAVDNGAKVMDHRGEMLEPEWEVFAQDLANCPEGEPMRQLLHHFISKHDISSFTSPATVVIAMDTRPSSQHLHDLCAEGVQAAGGQYVPLGLLTTPQLHWIVREYNANPQQCSLNHGKAKYEEHMRLHFSTCMGTFSSSLYLDCANGVGAVSLSTLASQLQPHLVVYAFNTNVSSSSDLNEKCGAEFVQKTRNLPHSIPLQGPEMRYASMDGDADRLVYYYCDETSLHLLDGDKIMCLLALYLKEQITDESLQLGVVQTAYANGASTQYLKERLQLDPICVPTGVKHLHHEAAQFDIGLYFEANGHGTVLFSSKAMAALEKSNTALYSFAMMSNQGVGDAIADLLLIEVILAKKLWSLRDWDAIYADFPSVQSKVRVKDRTLVKTTDAERKVVSPEGLQQEIDTAMSSVKQGRAFVRPSGTEDCVRIYAEAATMADAECLAQQVQSLVQRHLA